MIDSVLYWLDGAPLYQLGALLLLAMAAAWWAGHVMRRRRERRGEVSSSENQGYIVSAILGLLALLLGFTFSLAIDRFDARRILVLQDANAIGTAYLRVQLLPAPHRARLTNLLLQLTDNKLALATAPYRKTGALLAREDRLLTDIWAADAAAFDAIKHLDFSSTFLDSMNTMIELEASRRAARQAHVPTTVFAILLLYIVVTAGTLGFSLWGSGSPFSSGVLLVLFTLSLLLIVDIDRPTMGSIREQQGPMERLRASMRSQLPTVYDRWRMPEARQP